MTDRSSIDPGLDQKIIIYLLHFATPVGGKRHYLGSTTTSAFERRMRAHSQGYGSNLTIRAVAQETELTLVRTWIADDRSLEHRLKQRGHFNLHCSICSPTNQTLHNEKARRLPPSSLPIIRGFALNHPAVPRRQDHHQKRRR